MLTRREWMSCLAALAAPEANDPWKQADAILKRIVPPKFPARDFLITKYGAQAGGAVDASGALKQAIAACAAAGGGRVVVPEGRFLTGPVHLKSGVNLHLAAGSVLLFTTDPKAYLPAVFTRWEGMELMGYSPLVYAFGQKNIAVTGPGTLDGQAGAAHWWPWKGRTEYGWKKGDPHQAAARNKLGELSEKDVPVAERVFAEGSYLRPQFVETYKCENVLIEGVTILNSPMWEIHPVLCRNVTVRGVTVRSHGPNNDGCDPESCVDVLIENCKFDTGDDCIAIKSGRNRDGRRVNAPTENIIIRGCEMKDGHGGVTIGSEVSGGVRNVFAENCRMDSPNLDRVLRLKTNAVRGGFIENVYMRNVTVGQVADAVLHADFFYEEGEKGDFLPRVKNIVMEDVTCGRSQRAIYIRAFAKAPVEQVRLARCTFDNVKQGDVLENVKGLEQVDVRVNGTKR
ncbi:MAG: glycoside hydrolase family 28 protein [Acidobacteria bacterium]|nr:glycoside hydrolase family 28 protein [Acidobacteriota bacterium]